MPDLRKATKPFFNLMMFPYPSGEGLHVGHVYAFGGADTYGHFKKMQGYDVFEPMGFDSFGIHSENYAIKVGKHPKTLIEETTEYFRQKQLKRLGALFAWDQEVITSDPDYYQWTQWLFIQLFKAGLAVRKSAPVDWCPSCKTVLADEQVVAGKCERCSSEVIQRELEQWFFKITTFAEKLLTNLDKIDWSTTTKQMQKNWIGRSEGAEIEFEVKGLEGQKIKVYTTRPDTVFGSTFMVLAPEHPVVASIENKEVQEYVEEAKNKSEIDREKEKTGVFSGLYALNPLTKKEIPVWIADYVLMGYGTGAIMAVPAHDQRDFEFAKKYNLPITEAISGGDVSKEAWVGEGKLVNSGEFSGVTVKEGQQKISKYLEEHHLGQRTTNYHLRDWLISRQRYWGPPIPMVYCEKCAVEGKSWFTTAEAEVRSKKSEVKSEKNKEKKIPTSNFELRTYAQAMKGWYPVPEEDLPAKLPDLEDYQPKGKGVSPLATLTEFVNVKCPECGQDARRETDVSDTFLDSSWYFLRYPSVGIESSTKKIGGHEVKLPWNEEINKKWLPVDMYIGGNEHAVMHLLYTRFITMALNAMGFIDFEEPFKKFRALGLIIHKGAKMSKSRGNVVNPNEYMDAYGADALRMYLLFIGPFEAGGEFNDRAISGVYRFLTRVWNLVTETKFSDKENEYLSGRLNKLVAKLGSDLENLKFNTAIAALMEFLNELYGHKDKVSREVIKTYLKLLAPLAPFTAEELWEQIGEKGSIHTQNWPTYQRITEERITLPVQINGRLRSSVVVNSSDFPNEEKILEIVKQNETVKKHLEGRQLVKTIYVQGKIVNLVVR